MLAEAAGELFLEQGFAATSVAEIASRAGVSRATFFNYFTSKSDLLWLEIDERIGVVRSAIESCDATNVPRATLDALAAGDAPLTLALAIMDESNMGVQSELRRGRAERQQEIAEAVADRLRDTQIEPLQGEISGAATAAASMAALWEWANAGAGRASLASFVERSAQVLEHLWSPPSSQAPQKI